MLFLTNAFSLNMLEPQHVKINANRVDAATAASTIAGAPARGQPVTGCFGHQDIAAVASAELAMDAPDLFGVSRRTVSVRKKDEVIVAQYSGPRLPEGTTRLPEGATIVWWHLIVGNEE